MSDMITVLGGTEIEITHDDGRKETVKVRQIKLKLMGQMALAQDDDARLLELYAGQEPGWSDTVTTEDQMRLLEEGNRLNFPNFHRWLTLRVDTLQKLGPSAAKLQPMLDSQRSAPVSPTPAG